MTDDKDKKPFDPRADADGLFTPTPSAGKRRYSTIEHWRDGKAKVKPPGHTLTDFAQAIVDAAEKKEKGE